jgi:DUF971 family protein
MYFECHEKALYTWSYFHGKSYYELRNLLNNRLKRLIVQVKG